MYSLFPGCTFVVVVVEKGAAPDADPKRLSEPNLTYEEAVEKPNELLSTKKYNATGIEQVGEKEVGHED
ncbi:hypothetical protein CL632_00705 [bacterium]|jgi:hypothetical protein|nr:hypothetical protein [bacterium]MDP6571491.1 hypothetical protein [Patescibacteria group bacterium]|tara:strand:- start:35704 stop:35910 length:207 start_codon:yes stop_codon:yes gene_type:complete